MNKVIMYSLLLLSLLLSGCATTTELKPLTLNQGTGTFPARYELRTGEIIVDNKCPYRKDEINFVVVRTGTSIEETPFNNAIRETLANTSYFKKVISADEYFDFLVEHKDINPYELHFLSADALKMAGELYGGFLVLQIDVACVNNATCQIPDNPVLFGPMGNYMVNTMIGKYERVYTLRILESGTGNVAYEATLKRNDGNNTPTADIAGTLLNGFLAWYRKNVF